MNGGSANDHLPTWRGQGTRLAGRRRTAAIRSPRLMTIPLPLRRWPAVIHMAAALALLPSACAAAPVAEVPVQAPDRLWQVPAERPRGPEFRGESTVVRLDKAALDDLLRDAPKADAPGARGVVIALPMPDGSFSRFRIVESSVVSPELAAAFPDIRTYTGQGVDDPTATTRFGWTAAGFHAIVIGQTGSIYIDPYRPGDLEHYVSYRKAG